MGDADTPAPTPAITLGAVASLVAVGLLVGGSLLLWADRTLRDPDGFLLAPTDRVSTGPTR